MMVFTWGEKVNCVDRANTVVGYDLSQQCCEHAGWYISESRRADDDEKTTFQGDLESYLIDRAFFEQVAQKSDGNGIARFRLFADGKPDLFLHIYNAHNGYYGHGFVVIHSGQVVKEDFL